MTDISPRPDADSLSGTAPDVATAPDYPVAKRVEVTRSHHGDEMTDAYEWLRDKTDPDVIAHLEAENAYAEGVAADLAGLRAAIFTEIKGRTQESDTSVPARQGEWWYYHRTVEGGEYRLMCRSPYIAGELRPATDAPPAGEQVLVDGNALAQGQDFYMLGIYEVSHDGRFLAYGVDFAGDEKFALHVRDLESGEEIDDSLTGIGYDVAWSADGRYLFYTRLDEAWRPYQVWRHEVGGAAADDVLVFEELDERWWLGLTGSGDERWIMIAMGTRTSSEQWLLPADEPLGEFVVVSPRQEGLEYVVEPGGEELFVVTNRDRRDFSLMRATPDAMAADDWLPLWTPGDGTYVAGVEAYAGHLLLSLRREGSSVVAAVERRGPGQLGEFRDVPAPGEIASVSTGTNPEYAQTTWQVTSESLVWPSSTYDFDGLTGALTLLKCEPTPGHDPELYREWREWAIAEDGTRIPMSCVARRELTNDGTNPGLIYGYGSYEASIDPFYRPLLPSLLDRGLVYALAHVRGGGEMGRAWYEDGKLLAKKNTFTDFVACARHLLDTGWVDPERLAARGRSAGGLLMGAITNLAPDLFRVVDAGVPFVDALTTILDPSLPLTVGEWEEWGDPLHDADVYAYMKSYSPYENIAATRYPAILATTSLNDTRVFFTEPAKWVARLRETVTNDFAERPIVLRCEMVAGHFGKSGRYDAWRQQAWENAFVLGQLGATERVDR